MRFPGQYYDAESGLHQNWHRSYDPALGRYISSDPIGFAGGLNTFGYVGQSPLINTDPNGLLVQTCCRTADILGGAVSHCWLKTDTITAGMASSPQCRADVGDNIELPYATKTYVSDHSCETADSCIVEENIDESCVNNALEIGKGLGRFSAWNNCQTFAQGVINQCRIKPSFSCTLDHLLCRELYIINYFTKSLGF